MNCLKYLNVSFVGIMKTMSYCHMLQQLDFTEEHTLQKCIKKTITISKNMESLLIKCNPISWLPKGELYTSSNMELDTPRSRHRISRDHCLTSGSLSPFFIPPLSVIPLLPFWSAKFLFPKHDFSPLYIRRSCS